MDVRWWCSWTANVCGRYIHQLVMSLKATLEIMWCGLVNQKGAVV